MNIEIKHGVKKYLYEKNVQDVYIEMENRGGCCSGPVFVPVVKLGKPSYITMYDLFVKDEFTFYLPKKMSNEETENITIKLRNILGYKSLIVNGILAYKQKTWEKKKY
ncbi:CC/Se motif family (seleno)protein [Clostridium tagluense]|uniref:CC/Se motif family (seleno)protein n=1 Tax=Clostridium tagluense TaxID=360422 RepID=UPI001C6E9E76|nr:CC/Se motif family (seleno)protein [Clostridium tagluense]MBW9155226.1 hypothetical protein [Clostridium tagluense]WLC64659.1 hypothetical protein KTC93_17620 [Clostridium tagluense]